MSYTTSDIEQATFAAVHFNFYHRPSLWTICECCESSPVSQVLEVLNNSSKQSVVNHPWTYADKSNGKSRERIHTRTVPRISRNLKCIHGIWNPRHIRFRIKGNWVTNGSLVLLLWRVPEQSRITIVKIAITRFLYWLFIVINEFWSVRSRMPSTCKWHQMFDIVIRYL